MTSLPSFVFPASLVMTVAATGIFFMPETWYILVLLLLTYFFVLFLTRNRHDRGYFITCSAIPLLVACSSANIWAGLGTACLLAGNFRTMQALIETREDILVFGAYCTILLPLALLIHLANHVLLPFFVFAGTAIVLLAIQSIRTYQLKKHYTGA